MKEGIKIGETKTFTASGINGDSTFEITHTGIKLPTGRKAILEVFRDITKSVAAKEQLVSNAEELKKINKALVGRELKMIELKKQLSELKN